MSSTGPSRRSTTRPVSRGDIVDAVGATGTLEAVDDRPRRHAGVGRRPGALRRLQLHREEGPGHRAARSVAAADADRAAAGQRDRAQADLERLRCQLADAKQKLERAKQLFDAAADSRRPSSRPRRSTSRRRRRRSSRRRPPDAGEVAAEQAQVNLGHTVITAPIDGIVISRNVDLGQTVAAEHVRADALRHRGGPDQDAGASRTSTSRTSAACVPARSVTFRVDAYPTDTFIGAVPQVRLQPTVVQNVVTYSTVINVPNPELKLKPGMTANVDIEIARRNDVLRVPNAALRFRPTTDIFAALKQAAAGDAARRGAGRRPRRHGGRRRSRRRGGRAATGASRDGSPASARASQPALKAPAGKAPAAPSTSAQPDVAFAGTGNRGQRRRFGGDGAGGDAARRGRRRGGFGRNDADERRAHKSAGEHAGGGGGFAARPVREIRAAAAAGSGGAPRAVCRRTSRRRTRGWERGQDVSAFEAAASHREAIGQSPGRRRRGEAAPAVAETIDALFAPLPVIETRGTPGRI